MSLSHRKARKEIIFKDAQGNPLANRQVSIEQKSHSFLFGCGAFEFMNHIKDANDETADITSKWLKIFNYGTLPFYWGRYEPEEGKPDEETLMKTAKYLQERGVRVKGHPLCWHTVCADWLMNYDNATILKKQLDRIHREVTNFKGVIDMWDVINEVVIMPVFDKYDNAVTRICNDRGRIALVKDVFAAAHESNPDATLLINDFNLSEAYRILIDGLLNAGVPISAIGIQTHQHQGYMGREKLEVILRRFERFGLPLHFTENTLVSGHLMPGEIVDLNDVRHFLLVRKSTAAFLGRETAANVFLPFQTEMLGQKRIHGVVEVKSVLFVVETVAFIVLHHVLHFDAASAHRFDHGV